MTTRLTFSRPVWQQLDKHLAQSSPDEDGAFLLINHGRGRTSERLMAFDVLLPPPGAWESQGNHNLRPAGQWVSAAIGAAIEADSGLAFVHSHPASTHPSELSWVDQQTSKEWAQTFVPSLGRPFASLVWTPDDISGWMFSEADGDPIEISRFESLGSRRRSVLNGRPIMSYSDSDLDDRQTRALGALGNSRLRELSVTIVGAGGTGAPLAEILTRMGVNRLVLIDPDVIDTPSNLRRITGSRQADLEHQATKSSVVARHIRDLRLIPNVEGVEADVRTSDAAQLLLDADLIISTTDTHSSRALLNQVALQYFIPLVDVGTKVGTAVDGSISGMPVEVRVLLPDEPCLWCRGVLDSDRIRAENLPGAELRALEAEGYVQGVSEPQPSLAALNNLAASLASTVMLQLITDTPLVETSFIIDPWALYIQPLQVAVEPTCVCHSFRGRGDTVPLPTL